MATMAANASNAATVSFGLRSNIRISKPRSALALDEALDLASTLIEPRRRRGVASSIVTALGTFLHLIPDGLMARRRRQRCDIIRAIRALFNGRRQRQHDGDRGSLVDLALHRHLAAMQRNQALDDRQAKAGAFVAALIGVPCLAERVAAA